ncbi:MAG TPA: hypothetical protein VFJ74_02100 [Gemmatimonadaceae bacterium]|nr:hypothetical protein [Gemmatimonadaceae bacterium]
MDPYVFSLSLGATGLGVMAATGLASHGVGAAHHGHAGHGAGHHGGAHHASDVSLPAHGGVAHHGPLHGHAGAHHHTGTHDAGGHHHHVGGDGHVALQQQLVTLLSPRVLFSLLVGAGATGLLLRDLLGVSGLLLAALAVAGGVLFEAALVRPLWNFVFRFASAPALTLESCLFDEARAVSGFDRNGQGLIAVEMDGQLVQVLGTLRPEDRDAGLRVRAGDRVRIEDVDAKRNRCTVKYEGPGNE